MRHLLMRPFCSLPFDTVIMLLVSALCVAWAKRTCCIPSLTVHCRSTTSACYSRQASPALPSQTSMRSSAPHPGTVFSHPGTAFSHPGIAFSHPGTTFSHPGTAFTPWDCFLTAFSPFHTLELLSQASETFKGLAKLEATASLYSLDCIMLTCTLEPDSTSPDSADTWRAVTLRISSAYPNEPPSVVVRMSRDAQLAPQVPGCPCHTPDTNK